MTERGKTCSFCDLVVISQDPLCRGGGIQQEMELFTEIHGNMLTCYTSTNKKIVSTGIVVASMLNLRTSHEYIDMYKYI